MRICHGRRPRYQCIAENPYLENTSLQELAAKYCEKMEFPLPQHTPYVAVNESVSREIARIFNDTPDQSDNSEVRRAYGQFIKEVNQQWNLLPMKIEAFGDDWQPYKDSPAMMDDILNNNHLWVYDGGADHTLLTRKENFKFRAVHDAFGHSQKGMAFGPRGEENAWMDHCKLFSPLARRAMSTETRGQFSWTNWYGDHASLPLMKRPYAEQKALLMPLKYCTLSELQRAYADYPQFFPPVTAANPRRR